MAVGVKVVNRPGSLSQQMFLPAIAEGLGVTFRHFVKNFFLNVTGNRKKSDIATIEYPEEKKAYPERFRGKIAVHRWIYWRHAPRSSRSTSSAVSCAGYAPRPARATRSGWTPGSTPTRPTAASTASWTRRS